MMRKWLYYLVPGLVLLTGGTVYYSGPLQYHRLGVGRPVVQQMDLAAHHALQGEWPEAEARFRTAQAEWRRVRWRFSISAGIAERKDFEEELADLEGALEARNTSRVRIAHRRALLMWQDLTS